MSLTLTVKSIAKKYNGNTVLADCSFSFGPRGVYALMGPNGSGKSTFLRICALLDKPDSGEVVFSSGTDIITKDMKLMRRITLLLPETGVFNASVFSNAAYGLRIRGMRRHDYQVRVETALAAVGLAEKREQNGLTLSSGETRRLGIARALIVEPDIIFLDEPTASIDRDNTELIEKIIMNMKREGGPLVLLTTHDRAQAERLADRFLFLKDGRIEAPSPAALSLNCPQAAEISLPRDSRTGAV